MEIYEKYRNDFRTEKEEIRSILLSQGKLKIIIEAFPHVSEDVIVAMYYAANYEIERCYNALMILENEDDLEEVVVSEKRFQDLLAGYLQTHFENRFETETQYMKASLRSELQSKSNVYDDYELDLNISEESSNCTDELNETTEDIGQIEKTESKQIGYGTNSNVTQGWATVAQNGHQKASHVSPIAVQQQHIRHVANQIEERTKSAANLEVSKPENNGGSFFDICRNVTFNFLDSQSLWNSSQNQNTINEEQEPTSAVLKTETGFKYKKVENIKKPHDNQRTVVQNVPNSLGKENVLPKDQDIIVAVPINIDKLIKNDSTNGIIRNSTLENKESEFQGKRTPKKQVISEYSLNTQSHSNKQKDVKMLSPIKEPKPILPQLPNNNEPRIQNNIEKYDNSTSSQTEITNPDEPS